ncbi:UDP-glucose/GDP-mannose dehydrogenase family protein [Flavobacteriaceae bacterium S356]|uniref:UDP-glucose 6-dehydrogenase n=1 Tax=Asprobacillus argus TaxID=3076534 RepID=A0ABU3LIC6_9FLAO|nr:UDP-glucose/GDP-mannose dehydrogenase family protein [Flavobacteriaceae bacterium S356]
MKIVVIGTGYVGLVSGACFSEMGNTVVCVDVDSDKIGKLKKGIIPIYEPGLEAIIKKNRSQKNIYFSTSIEESIKDASIVFIAVGTPMKEDGAADLQSVFSVAKEIGKSMTARLVIVNKSTVPVGTAYRLKEIVAKELKLRESIVDFDIVSNPEFLKEGSAITDFMKPDRVIIGSDSEYASKKMKELYSPFFRTHQRYLEMDIRSAEMTKYAANAMLATKISFINEMAIICEKLDADINQVRLGIGSDKRIGYDFIYPGVGYGGTCFPKDISAIQKVAKEAGYIPKLLDSVSRINQYQKVYFLQKITSRFGEDLSGKVFGIWGLTFKPGTNDMREAPSIFMINELISRGAKIKAYDPKVSQESVNFYINNKENVLICKSKYEVLTNVQALILLTEWKEFRSPDFDKIKKELLNPVIFDGRNQYGSFELKDKGFEYYQIGKN